MNPTRSLLFPPGSCRHTIESATFKPTVSTDTIARNRRFALAPDSLALLQGHIVVGARRLENDHHRARADPLL